MQGGTQDLDEIEPAGICWLEKGEESVYVWFVGRAAVKSWDAGPFLMKFACEAGGVENNVLHGMPGRGVIFKE